MTTLAFVDVETTHLDAEIGEAWEVAVILREQTGPQQFTDTEYCWQIRPDLISFDPEALRIGRFEERFAVPPGAGAAFTAHESGHITPMTCAEAVTAIMITLSGVVVVGSNPAFDDRFLRKLLGPGSAQWHYRPYDIVQLAAAKIGAQAAGPLPWRAHVLSRAVGVEPPTAEAAHTALGDARWARDVHDAAMVREQIPPTWEGRANHAIGLYTKTAVELEDARRDVARHDKIAKGLHVYSHVLRARPGREVTTDYVRACLDQLIEHPEGVCDLDQNEAAIKRVRERCQAVRDRVGPGGMINASQILGLLSPTWPDGDFEAAPPTDGPSQPVMTGETDTAFVPRTERSRWVDIAAALNAAHDAGMPVGIDLDGTLTDRRSWSVVWDPATERWTVAGYEDEGDETPCTCTAAEACEQCADDDQDDEEFEETGDADGDVFELISTIAGRLRDATDEGEYHAVGLIHDLANGRTTIADARAELAEITFRHV